jgi:hypothetical protein
LIIDKGTKKHVLEEKKTASSTNGAGKTGYLKRPVI